MYFSLILNDLFIIEFNMSAQLLDIYSIFENYIIFYNCLLINPIKKNTNLFI